MQTDLSNIWSQEYIYIYIYIYIEMIDCHKFDGMIEIWGKFE